MWLLATFFSSLIMAAAASSASLMPDGGSPSTKTNSFAAQLRPKRKVACDEENDKNQHNYRLLSDVLKHCDNFPEDVGNIHNNAMKLKKKREDQEKANLMLSTQFQNFSTLKSLDEDFVMAWVLDHSDLTVEDILSARQQDKDCAYLLASCATQLPLHFKLPGELNSKQIMASFMTSRNRVCGLRLQNFKRRGGLQASGKLNFNHSSFVLTWAEQGDQLKTIHHISTPGNVKNTPGAWLTKKCDFENFWDDHSASVRVEGLPKVALHSLFGKQPTKFKYNPANSKNAEFKQEIVNIVEEHVKKAELMKKGSAASPLKGDLAKLNAAENKEKMVAIQEKMLGKIAEKRAKRKLNLDEVASES
jgi:hypothetical protein